MDCSGTPPPAFWAGIAQFNAGEFYECHETLEAIWVAEKGDIRRLYQGILQIGVGFYHLQRGNFRGATSLMEGGLRYVNAFRPACLGINVQKLMDDTIHCFSLVSELGKGRLNEFDWALVPKIERT